MSTPVFVAAFIASYLFVLALVFCTLAFVHPQQRRDPSDRLLGTASGLAAAWAAFLTPLFWFAVMT